MNMRDLMPRGRSERSSLPGLRGEESPFLQLHREMNRLFADMLGRFDVPAFGPRGGGMSWPSLELAEADGALKVIAEVPGMDENDIEVLLDGDILTIRGERKEDVEDEGRRFSERFYGRFERFVRLPFEVEEGKVEASFDKGMLTVTLPRSAKAQAKTRRIAVNAGNDRKSGAKS